MLGAIAPTLANPDKHGDLIDIQQINPRIVLDIRYATPNNFTHRRLYSQPRCLLRTAVAQRLARVQVELEAQGLGLKVYDCYRPLSVQKELWKLIPDDRYVANPAQGSRHNRGSAVDLTLVDRYGKELEMPTPFDEFSDRAHIDYPHMTPTARKNMQRLQAVMQKHGFTTIPSEWWHFDAKEWNQYSVLDIPLDAVP